MIRIAASARQDLDEGFQFYESQEIGLGDYFPSSLKADIESLRVTAGVHKIAYVDYHRLLSARRSLSRSTTPKQTGRSQYSL